MRFFILYRRSYLETGKSVKGEEPIIPFAVNYRMVSDYFNLLVDAGFVVERLVEPDSRQRYPYDPWYGKWDYASELMQKLPPTIIFKSKKR